MLTPTAFPYGNFQTASHPRLRPTDFVDHDSSLPVLRRHAGGALRPGSQPVAPGKKAVVESFIDSPDATLAAFSWNDPRGWGVHQRRRIFFVKNGFLLVRDGFEFPPERRRMEASVGPVWHVGGVREQSPDGWFDACQNAPLAQRWRYRNPEQYALIRFLRRGSAYRIGAFREGAYAPSEVEQRPECSQENSPVVIDGTVDCRLAPPYVLYQRWTGESSAGPAGARWFDTVIVPHGAPDGASANDRVKVLSIDRFSVVLEILGPDGTRWTLVDNPLSPRPVMGGRVATNARSLLVRDDGAEPVEAIYSGGSALYFDGRTTTWEQATSGQTQIPAHACGDGVDNDGDGLVDLSDPGCRKIDGSMEDPACNDGIDNDRDGFIDLEDPECEDASGSQEGRCGRGYAQAGLCLSIVAACRRRRRSRSRSGRIRPTELP